MKNHTPLLPLRASAFSIRALLTALVVTPLTSLADQAREEKISSADVSVAGQIRAPGLFQISPATTLSELIAKAGGFTEMAKSDAIRISRRKKDGATEVLIVDGSSKEKAAASFHLAANDVVYVPTKEKG